MTNQFRKHYSKEEASALLPQLRLWLEELRKAQSIWTSRTERLAQLGGKGDDLGGESVNDSIRAFGKMKEILAEFGRREIQIKDVQRGLIDFPAIRFGKEVFLCWEEGEEDIEHWHDLESGYSGRSPL